MTIQKGKIREDFIRDLYWTKIVFRSDDKKKESAVFACVSWEYICDTNRTNKIRDKFLSKWLNDIIKKKEKLGNKIFEKKVHFEINAVTNEGKLNALKFLKEI